MKILVCVKQVPDTNEVRIDPVTNNLVRAGVPAILNPFDEFAVELGMQIKEQVVNATLTVLTMGPPHATYVLREAYAMGADEMVLVSDRMFGGADTLATSYTISEVIKLLGGFDIILCGKQATDGDTAQVGPEIAEHLDIPQITYAIEAKVKGQKIEVKRENDDMYEIWESELPVLLTATKTEILPRYPNLLRWVQSEKEEIRTITAADLTSADSTRFGLKGSPTRVRKIFAPKRKSDGIKIQGYSSIEAAELAIQHLMKENKA